MLLAVMEDAAYFEGVGTYYGAVYDKFMESVQATGLVSCDKDWEWCLREATLFQSGHAVRQLFLGALLDRGSSGSLGQIKGRYV